MTTDVSQGDSAIKRTQDARANLIWAPYKMINVGGELLWGRRDNRNGAHGDAVRLQVSMIFNLN